ncbi:hypothetical protein D3C87_1311740 [compost metagenome]
MSSMPSLPVSSRRATTYRRLKQVSAGLTGQSTPAIFNAWVKISTSTDSMSSGAGACKSSNSRAASSGVKSCAQHGQALMVAVFRRSGASSPPSSASSGPSPASRRYSPREPVAKRRAPGSPARAAYAAASPLRTANAGCRDLASCAPSSTNCHKPADCVAPMPSASCRDWPSSPNATAADAAAPTAPAVAVA